MAAIDPQSGKADVPESPICCRSEPPHTDVKLAAPLLFSKFFDAEFMPDPGEIISGHGVCVVRMDRCSIFDELEPFNELLTAACSFCRFAWSYIAEHPNALFECFEVMPVECIVNQLGRNLGRNIGTLRGWPLIIACCLFDGLNFCQRLTNGAPQQFGQDSGPSFGPTSGVDRKDE